VGNLIEFHDFILLVIFSKNLMHAKNVCFTVYMIIMHVDNASLIYVEISADNKSCTAWRW